MTDTVLWYKGESGATPARQTTVAQVGPSTTISYGMRASEQVQARFDYLADKNTEGTLNPEERAEYEALVSGTTFISILQAKARALLAHGDGR